MVYLLIGAILGNFDPATEVYKEPPAGLNAIVDFVTSQHESGEAVFWNPNLLKRKDWQKFQTIATNFYNVNDVVDDDGDALIEDICNLCLEGVKKAFERQGK